MRGKKDGCLSLTVAQSLDFNMPVNFNSQMVSSLARKGMTCFPCS